jgi:lipid-binding SYLF domain-containing protein
VEGWQHTGTDGSGGSWGLQIGVEGVDLVMLVMNDKGLQHLLSSKLELTGEGSVAAGPVGRHASAATDWKMNTEMLTYSRSKGCPEASRRSCPTRRLLRNTFRGA